MKITIRILTFVAFLISLIWFYKEGGFEPIVTSIASLSALIGTFILQGESSSCHVEQKQNIGDNSNGIQVGGSININKNKDK